jgi:hypothetical protein
MICFTLKECDGGKDVKTVEVSGTSVEECNAIWALQ